MTIIIVQYNLRMTFMHVEVLYIYNVFLWELHAWSLKLKLEQFGYILNKPTRTIYYCFNCVKQKYYLYRTWRTLEWHVALILYAAWGALCPLPLPGLTLDSREIRSKRETSTHGSLRNTDPPRLHRFELFIHVYKMLDAIIFFI